MGYYHPYPVGTRVSGVYQDEAGDDCVGPATVTRAWWSGRLPGVAIACVGLTFDGNGTPDDYRGPVPLLVHPTPRAWPA